jgi:uncharacterized membrane protein YkoI
MNKLILPNTLLLLSLLTPSLVVARGDDGNHHRVNNISRVNSHRIDSNKRPHEPRQYDQKSNKNQRFNQQQRTTRQKQFTPRRFNARARNQGQRLTPNGFARQPSSNRSRQLRQGSRHAISKKQAHNTAQQRYPGRILSVKRSGDTFRVKTLNDNGQLRVVVIDAYNGNIISLP